MSGQYAASSSPIPVEIRRLTDNLEHGPVGRGMLIRWSNNEISNLSSETLRTHCPCATCREQRGDISHTAPLVGRAGLLTVVKATADEQLNLSMVWPVGNYAIGMRWADGHDTGIYSYGFLLSLSQDGATQGPSETFQK